jgi:hypothetical protein
MKNYKPQIRGAAFTNKIMAKKRNVLKFRENFKRKLQIEQAKHRGQVDVYGGLAKVGMDNTLGPDGQEEKEEMAPGFSTSAMRYVKDLIKTHRSDDDEEEEEENIQDSQDEECLLGEENDDE